MVPNRYRIQFPPDKEHNLGQDEAYFHLIENGETQRIKFHDYDVIYRFPGLYEQLFYERLQCCSPAKVRELLQLGVESENLVCSKLRVLDLGAGNGHMAEELKSLGVARIVGADIIPEARDAAFRDRPHVYDDYFVGDFTNLSDEETTSLKDWHFDCFTSVAALGFGDIPPQAFFQGLQFLPVGGWVAFNIKESFLDETDQSGFSRFIRQLILSKYLTVYHLERYRHRLSMEGVPLSYYALVGRVTEELPANVLEV
jgi:predicted TPR repeat methyltransferase